MGITQTLLLDLDSLLLDTFIAARAQIQGKIKRAKNQSDPRFIVIEKNNTSGISFWCKIGSQMAHRNRN